MWFQKSSPAPQGALACELLLLSLSTLEAKGLDLYNPTPLPIICSLASLGKAASINQGQSFRKGAGVSH